MYYTNTGGYSIRVLSNLNSEIRKESAKWSHEIWDSYVGRFQPFIGHEDPYGE